MITLQSFKEMKLEEGKNVLAGFKASNVILGIGR